MEDPFKRRKIFGQRKNKTEKEQEENFGRGKCLISEGEVKQRRKRRKSFGEGKIGRGLVFIKDSIRGPRRPKKYVFV